MFVKTRPCAGGFTLVEAMIAIGITSLLVLAAGGFMNGMQKSLMRTQSAAALGQTQMLMNRWFSSGQSGGATCAQILQLPAGGSFQMPTQGRNPQTPIEIHDPTNAASSYSSSAGHNTVSGASPFTISALYLGDATLAHTEGTGASQKSVYISTLWLEGRLADQQAISRRAVSSIAVRVNSANQIIDCNAAVGENNEDACADLGSGYLWVGGACVSQVRTDSHGNIACQQGLILASDGRCWPTNVTCGAQKIPQGFINNSMSGCTGYTN